MNTQKKHFYQAFDATVKKFDLDIHEISKVSGVPPSKLELFRGGFDTNIDTVESLIVALPMEARHHLMEWMVNADRTSQSSKINTLQAI
jgi:predicted transcriptional regulator